MPNPVLVEVRRGSLVESCHRGAVAVLDADGASVLAIGDVARPVFPRSAVKAIQALPLLVSGAADRAGLSDEDIVLACASHSGEPRHVAGVARMLGKTGRGEACLACGAQWPLGVEAARALARSGEPAGALHNNCSGKHAGFICLADALGVAPADYCRPEHPVQHDVRGALEALTGARHDDRNRGTDGCSVPTYAVPLAALALAFARFGTGARLTPALGGAATRLRAAVAAHPFMLAGTGRFDTAVTRLLGPRAFIKGGAEGVQCCALPTEGLGIAVKCDDGSRRGAEAVMAALLVKLLPMAPTERIAIDAFARPTLRNWSGMAIGAIVPAAQLC